MNPSHAGPDPYDFINAPAQWSMFKYYELHEIMRQKDDISFAQQLTRFGRGESTREDLLFFESLQKPESSISYEDNTIHLFFDNASVNNYNTLALSKIEGKSDKCSALDYGNPKILQCIPSLSVQDKNGLYDEIFLKQNAKYMVIANIDTEDGLVNGAVGTLWEWDYETNIKTQEKRVFRVWIEFEDESIGNKTRNKYISTESRNGWTPIERRKEESHIKATQIVKFTRHQFPIVPSQAMTIHKSQGATYEKFPYTFQNTHSTNVFYFMWH